MIVHRALKWALEIRRCHRTRGLPSDPKAENHGDDWALSPRGIRGIAAESSEAERRADSAERELMEWKTAQFMESHLGEEFQR